MKTIVRLIFLLLLIVGWGLAALSLHVVRTNDQIPVTLVTKDQLGVTDTYVDARNWTVDDLGKHEAVVQKLIHDGKADVLRHVVDPSSKRKPADVATQLSDALRHAPKKDENSRSLQAAASEQATRGLLSWLLG